MRTATILALGGALALAACAGGPRPDEGSAEGAPAARQAQGAVASVDALLFVGFDDNHDARIDAAELTAGIAREFTRADGNGDGSVAPLEFGAWSRLALADGRGAPYRLDFDRNVDGVITQQEFHAELEARAREYDKDHDGVLLRAEFVRDAPRLMQMRGPMQGGTRMRRRPPGM
jgi:hypothetical protein